MKHLGRLLALLGLVLAVVLVAGDDPRRIWALVRDAAPGLVLAGLFHLVPMALNARAWQILLPGAGRAGLAAMTLAVWVRESVNGLLPVARIGGELVSYRLLRRFGARRAAAAASLVVDMALAMVSQFMFALLGVALLIGEGGDDKLALQLTLGLAAMLPVATGFLLVQRSGLFERVTRLLDRFAAGRLEAVIGHSARIDRAIRTLYRRRRVVLACTGWQLAGWIAGAGEIWLALHFLGHSVHPLTAVAIEALIQAASSAAFVVPGALGVQEGAFVLVGAAVGLDAPTALALAAARRLRDLVVFFPGLLAWQWSERASGRGRGGGGPPPGQ
jgi:putative membrane protein